MRPQPVLPIGLRMVHKGIDAAVIPSVAQDLLDDGRVLAFRAIALLPGPKDNHSMAEWKTGIEVCIKTGQEQPIWISHWSDLRTIQGMGDAICALTQPYPVPAYICAAHWSTYTEQYGTHKVAMTWARDACWIGMAEPLHDTNGELPRLRASHATGPEAFAAHLARHRFDAGVLATVLLEAGTAVSSHQRLALPDRLENTVRLIQQIDQPITSSLLGSLPLCVPPITSLVQSLA